MLATDLFRYHTEADSVGEVLPVVCGAMPGIGLKCKALLYNFLFSIFFPDN